MRQTIIVIMTVLALVLFNTAAMSDEMSSLVEQFASEYDALVPPPNSSVRTDYKQAQTALGALYTTRAISLLYEQNQALSDKYDRMLDKYSEIVEQNKEIIRLLAEIAERDGQ